LEIGFSSRRIVGILLIVWIILVVASILANLLENFNTGQYLTNEALESYVRLFSLDKEANIPTWYSSLLLFIASITLTIISLLASKRGEPYFRHWAFLALIFLGLSMDETAIIHEMLVKPMKMAFHTTGFLYYGWVIPGALFSMAIAFAYRKFLFALASSTRIQIIIAGAIYVLGALVFESIGGKVAQTTGESGFAYNALTTLEEASEMLGVIVFIFALLQYLAKNFGEFQISFRPFFKAELLREDTDREDFQTKL